MKGGDMAKAKKCVPILVIFLMAFGVCMTETIPTINHLMNEPVSLFDFGMHRLEEHLNENIYLMLIAKNEPTVTYQK